MRRDARLRVPPADLFDALKRGKFPVVQEAHSTDKVVAISDGGSCVQHTRQSRRTQRLWATQPSTARTKRVPKYKRQHFLARSHLRRFADERGHLQIINVDTGEVEKNRHPRSVGTENYFYGRQERALHEHGFKLIEEEANAWMHEIQRTEELPSRGSAGHVVIAMWTAIQHGRTRKGRNAVNEAMTTLGAEPERGQTVPQCCRQSGQGWIFHTCTTCLTSS